MSEEFMDFADLKRWLKERGLTFKLEGWSCCIPDTILIFDKDHRLLYEGEYHHEVNYLHAVKSIEAQGEY